MRKTQKGVERMDYWEYIAHSQKGEERANHRYYAREQVGTTRLGFPKYRYFYDAREYGAYKTRQQQGKSESTRTKERGHTTFTIGEGKQLGKAPSYEKVGRSIEEYDLLRANNASGKGYTQWGEQDGKFTDGLGLYSAKTVRDYKKPLRKVKQLVNGRKKKNTSSSSKKTSSATRHLETEARAAQVHKDAVAYRRKRSQESVRAEKVQMDAKRYRKQKRERIKANRIAQQHTMDRERWKRNEKAEQAKSRGDKHNTRVQEAIREKVHKDAVAYRRKRAQESIRAQKDKYVPFDHHPRRRKIHQHMVRLASDPIQSAGDRGGDGAHEVCDRRRPQRRAGLQPDPFRQTGL